MALNRHRIERSVAMDLHLSEDRFQELIEQGLIDELEVFSMTVSQFAFPVDGHIDTSE